MKLGKVIVSRRKLTHYLLVPQDHDDKSGYLALAGFTNETADALLSELTRLAQDEDASESRTNEYGTLYEVRGLLTGPNSRELPVSTYWIKRFVDGEVHFVTLTPAETGK